jgi:predicted O-methyltransferase YrrM
MTRSRIRPAAARIGASLQAAYAVRRLSREPAARSIARALTDVTKRTRSVDEQALLERIEDLRSELIRSQDTLDVVDYGCGLPDDEVGRDEMDRGRRFSRTVRQTCRDGSKGPHEALLLFELVRAFRPNACLELGTSLGISAAYQGAGLELNGNGRLITIEGAPALADSARRNLAMLGLDHRVEVLTGRFSDHLPDLLKNGFDFSFIDGDHEEEATVAYFDGIVTSTRGQRQLTVLDDVRWSPGMARAWQRIRDDSRTRVAVEWHGMGIVLA